MTPAQRDALAAVRSAPSTTLAAAWPEVLRRPATVEEAMDQRWVGLAICAEMFRRGHVSILPSDRDPTSRSSRRTESSP